MALMEDREPATASKGCETFGLVSKFSSSPSSDTTATVCAVAFARRRMKNAGMLQDATTMARNA